MFVIISNSKYLIVKEFNIRKFLVINNVFYGLKGEEGVYNSKFIILNVIFLFFVYLVFEDEGRYINIYGVGFGYGVGML